MDNSLERSIKGNVYKVVTEKRIVEVTIVKALDEEDAEDIVYNNLNNEYSNDDNIDYEVLEVIEQ